MTAWPGSKTSAYKGEGRHDDVNTYIRDALDNLYNAPCCVLSRTSQQSLANGFAINAIAWTTEVEDAYGFHAANATDMIVPAGLDGLYVIFAICEVALSGNGDDLEMDIFLNDPIEAGTPPAYGIAGDTGQYPSAVAVELACSTLWPLAAGDRLTVEIYHNASSAKNLLVTSDYSPRFGLVRVAP